MSLDTNTWYSIQSFGTDYNLAVGNSSSETPVFSQADGQADNALWQVNPASGDAPSFLRTRSTGAGLCLSGANGELSVAECSEASVWTVALFNGENPSDGYYLAPGDSSTTPRLNEAETGNTVSLQEYSESSGGDVYFQWAFRSVSAIDDDSYSAVPTGDGSSSSTTTTTTTNTTSTTSTTSSSSSSPSSSSSTPTPTSSSSEVVTETFTADPTSTSPPVQTETVIVTRPSSNPSTTSTGAGVSPTTVPGNKANSPSFSTTTLILTSLLGLAIGLNFR